MNSDDIADELRHASIEKNLLVTAGRIEAMIRTKAIMVDSMKVRLFFRFGRLRGLFCE